MRNILLVDDSPTFLKILERLLTSHYKVVGKANNGIEGFVLYKKLKPDFVLLDITMPNCNGKDCLKMIREFDKNAKVIMVSSLGDDATLAECKALGAIGFIKKDLISVQSSPEESLTKTLDNLIAS